MRHTNGRRPQPCAASLGVSLASACGAFALAALSAQPAAASGGAQPDVTHVGTLKGGHEGPPEGATAGGTEVVIRGNKLRFEDESCVFSQELSGYGTYSEGPLLSGCSDVIVRFGTEPGLVAAASEHQIDVFSPPHKAGSVDVTVTTRGGISATHSADHYTYIGSPPAVGSRPLPTVKNISPDRGPTTGFTTVSITGEHLLPSGDAACVECARVSVRFGKRAVPALQGTQSELLVVSPPHEPGTVDVFVSAAGLTSAATTADRFSFTAHHHHRRHHHHRSRHRR
jgi:IPT/TIG domain